ncbi:MAG: YesL family protein [Clostridia bacterium]|nr:YesL family protein [Clostridia bacterium]
MGKKYENINDYSEELEKKKKKRMTLNPFENMFTKDGKGVEKDEIQVLDKPDLGNFFKLLFRKLNHIFSVNILLICGNFPIFFMLFAYAYTTVDILGPSSQIYPLVRGVSYFDNSPTVMTLLGIFGNQDSRFLPTTATYIFWGLTALVFFTFGLVNVGTTYINRNLLRGEPVFIMSDFWYAIKRNWKQALGFGIMDLLMIVILVYDIMYYRARLAVGGLFMTMYVVGYGMAIIYSFLRVYAYLMIVTFDMKLSKILKNSLYFSVLGIKRNALALLGTIVLIVLDYLLIRIFTPIGLIIPFIILFGLVQFMFIYAAFPKIKQIMIDPYYREVENSKQPEEEAEEPEEA